VPDVVISDIGLPDEDGYSLSRWVRGRASPVPPPPMIAVTAQGDRTATQAAGFVAHVTKPVDIPRLLQAVFQVLDSKRRNEPSGDGSSSR
jgi:CheY-like chemotaxis protein